jgi:Fe(3+) dicitrate transport protein
MKNIGTVLFVSIFIFNQLLAQETALPATATMDSSGIILTVYEIPAVKVLGKKPRLMSDVPGSASFLSQKKIQSIKAISGNEVFRNIPGVHVVDEEGLGLRANIGIRGLDPDRSSKVLVLEDGIPVALNPFGEPQLYYTPTIDKMEAIEVLKGSGQILFGPQTIGGVINYITADPPKESTGVVKLRGGQGGFFSGLIGYGNTYDKIGIQINYLRKQANEVGPTNFKLDDLSGKINLQISNKSSIGIKLGIYDEWSNSTYVGLTQAMYDQGGQDFAIIAPDDQLAVRRVSGSVTHEYRPNLYTKIQTTAFAYTTTRNWQRQDFSYSPSASNQTGVVWGDPNIEGGAIYLRDQNGHRNRQFEVAGIEPRISYRYDLGIVNNKLDAGVRYMYERAFEQRVNGLKKDAESGNLINDEVRTGNSFSSYFQNQFILSKKVSITAGVRSEVYNYERNIIRTNQIDTSIVSSSFTTKVIPGIGFNFNINSSSTIFGGLHRGFAPPRIVDAISNNGIVYNLEPELSWNSEIGLRSQIKDFANIEITLFHMNFSNQIIPVSESSGGTGSGVVNGGNTLHQGLELGFEFNFGQFFLPENYDLSWSSNVTFVQSFFNENRFIESNNELINIKDNRTPYSPELLISSAIMFETPFGLSIRCNGTYTSDQFTDELNTIQPANNGRIGKLPSYLLMDATLMYFLDKQNLGFSFNIKNLTDKRYISTRRPQGIRVGLSRYISLGIEKKF